MYDEKPLMLWITTGWPPEVGGPATGNLDRARWFARSGRFRLVILAPEHPDGAQTTVGEGPDAPEVILYPSKPWPPYPVFRVPTLRATRLIESTVERLRPDLILHTDLERSHLLAGWRLAGRSWARRNKVPYLAYYHTDFYGFAAVYPFWRHVRGFVLHPYISRLYRQVDATLCASPTAVEQVRGFGAERVYGVPFDGVDTTGFSSERRDRSVLARLVPYVDFPGKVVLSIGRIAPEKRLDLTLAAVGRLQATDRHRDVSLIVAGEGSPDLTERLRGQAASLPRPDRVHFIGVVRGDDKADLMASCDVLSLPCPAETFAITATECMASGLPVVCADTGAPQDYVEHGRNGFLHRSENLASLTETLAHALDADRTAIGQAAAETVRRRFSMDRIGRGLEDLLLPIATQGRFPAGGNDFATTRNGG